jgi:V8-like Glu-specific endopeptidase
MATIPPPIEDIAARWQESTDKVDAALAAVRERRLDMANTDAEIERRQRRLKSHGLDLEGIVDKDDSVWLTFFSRGLTVARAVGRVVRTPPRQPIRPEGTGVLISSQLLLTNNHVIPEAAEAAEMGVQFHYEYGDDGQELQPDLWHFAPGAFFSTDEDLDFTVVAVAEQPGQDPPGRAYGCVRLIEQTGKVLMGEAINVVHHPAGDRKSVSIRENRLVAEDELWLRYLSDTRHGSSGAPVFNDQWEMVALHHGGVPQRDPRGRRLSLAGTPWTQDMGEDAVAYIGNEGARVSKIVGRLRDADLIESQRKFFEQEWAEGAHQ